MGPITSGVIVEREEGPGLLGEAVKPTEIAMRALNELREENEIVTVKAWRERCRAMGISRGHSKRAQEIAFKNVLEDLVVEGTVSVDNPLQLPSTVSSGE